MATMYMLIKYLSIYLFGQNQDMELLNNQFPETKILGLLVSWRMCGLVYLVCRDKVDVDTFNKGIQYALEN